MRWANALLMPPVMFCRKTGSQPKKSWQLAVMVRHFDTNPVQCHLSRYKSATPVSLRLVPALRSSPISGAAIWQSVDRVRRLRRHSINGFSGTTTAIGWCSISPANGSVTGFDTGPGNTLLDAWVRQHHNRDFDLDGSWASQGQASEKLLLALLQDPFFAERPPKSTGFEYFNLEWLERKIAESRVGPAQQDVQATLAELTCRSIADAITLHAPGTTEVFVCGGGFHNRDLMRRLGSRLRDVSIQSTSAHGLDPDWVEAAAFAWLAKRRISGETGNLPSVTGASRSVPLGGIFAS
jgi:Anhydro-N-acetylmuramic acid kinase